MIKKITLSVLISIFVIVILSMFMEFDSIRGILQRMCLGELVVGFLFIILANIVRSMRFSTLEGGNNDLKKWLVVNQIYNLMTATFPGGIGELSTAWILKKISSFPFLVSVRMFFVTRVMDLLIFSIIMIVSVLCLRQHVNHFNLSLLVSVSFFVISIMSLTPSLERMFLIFSRSLVSGESKFTIKINDSIQSLIDVSNQDQYPKKLATSLIQSFFVVTGAALSTHFVIHSLGIVFLWQQSFYCFAIYALFQLVPIQGFAGIGTQAAWWAFALYSAGYQGSDSLEIGIVLHAVFYLFIAIMAFFACFIWFSLWLFSRNCTKKM